MTKRRKYLDHKSLTRALAPANWMAPDPLKWLQNFVLK